MDLLPGFAQGVTRVFISYPFDYVRIHLQKNKYDSVRGYFKSNGYNIFNLYRGIKYPLSIIPIDRAITFKIYEDLNKKHNPFVSSLIASSMTCLYNVPLQSINTNYILENSNKSYFKFITEVIKNYKANFLYKSFTTEYLRSVSGSVLYMGMYGNLRNVLPDKKAYYMLNGAITNIFVWTFIYPLDTIRVEHQSNQKSLFGTIKNKFMNEGVRSFYKGISLVYIRSLPSATIGMLVYETVKKNI